MLAGWGGNSCPNKGEKKMGAVEGRQFRKKGVMRPWVCLRHDGMAGVESWGLGLERWSRLWSCQIIKN